MTAWSLGGHRRLDDQGIGRPAQVERPVRAGDRDVVVDEEGAAAAEQEVVTAVGVEVAEVELVGGIAPGQPDLGGRVAAVDGGVGADGDRRAPAEDEVLPTVAVDVAEVEAGAGRAPGE